MGTSLFVIYLCISATLVKRELNKDQINGIQEGVEEVIEDILEYQDEDTRIDLELFLEKRKKLIVPSLIVLIYCLYPLMCLKYYVSKL